MDNPASDPAAARLDRLARENRRWRLAAIAAATAAVLLLWARLEPPRQAAAQAARTADSTVILKFGGYYINAQMITYIDFQTDRNAVQLYFAGDTKGPLRLNAQYGEAMRPWLDGHSFDLTAEPSKDPNPKSFRKLGLPEK